jgi:hypothetical protein
MARDVGPPDIYVEACAMCEALANSDGNWNKAVDMRDVAAHIRRQGIHLVPETLSENN